MTGRVNAVFFLLCYRPRGRPSTTTDKTIIYAKYYTYVSKPWLFNSKNEYNER